MLPDADMDLAGRAAAAAPDATAGLSNGGVPDDDNLVSSSWSAFLVALVTFAAEVVVAVGGVVPYIPQYLTIKRTRNTSGFSKDVCLALVLANTLRILFWFGRRYELPLLLQSVIMIVTMMELIRLCVNVEAKRASEELLLVKDGRGEETRTFADFNPRHFWRWTDFQSYVEALSAFAALGSLVMLIMVRFKLFVEAVGFLSVFAEAMLGTPQFYKNYSNKSTVGMSLTMVVMWTSGDVFKTVYFVLRQAPVQFAVCGALQVSIDVAILGQTWIYRHNTAKMNRHNPVMMMTDPANQSP